MGGRRIAMSLRIGYRAGALALAVVTLAVGARVVTAQSPGREPPRGSVATSSPADGSQGPAKLPPALEVLSRYTRAIGGEQAIRQYRSRRAVGRFELRAQGLSGPIEILAASPDRMLIRITLEGLGDMLRGYDGAIGWSMDPAVGPRVLSGRELEEMQYSADFYADIYRPADYASMTVIGRGPFEGHDCFTVKLVRSSGFESLEYFDTRSGLRMGGRMTSTSMMGSVPDVVTVFGEYRGFGGILTPVIATQRAMGVESLLTLERIEYDNVRDEELRPPAAIQGLIKGSRAQG
jgi:hypothetical protein